MGQQELDDFVGEVYDPTDEWSEGGADLAEGEFRLYQWDSGEATGRTPTERGETGETPEPDDGREQDTLGGSD